MTSYELWKAWLLIEGTKLGISLILLLIIVISIITIEINKTNRRRTKNDK